jgi:hypothetical protein
MASKAALLAAYQGELEARYPWASNKEKLAKFIRESAECMRLGSNALDYKGPAFKAALVKVGLPANIALQFLAELPES